MWKCSHQIADVYSKTSVWRQRSPSDFVISIRLETLLPAKARQKPEQGKLIDADAMGSRSPNSRGPNKNQNPVAEFSGALVNFGSGIDRRNHRTDALVLS